METSVSVDLALVGGKPPLRALADVTLCWSEGELTLRRFAVFEKTGQPGLGERTSVAGREERPQGLRALT